MDFQELLGRLDSVKQVGDYHTAQCPGHADAHNSLQVSRQDNGKITVTCHAKCDIEAILGPLGWQASDLYPPKSNGDAKRKPRKVAKVYDYTDANDKLLFQVVRYEPKGFAQRQPDREHHGSWIWNLTGVKRRLYRQNEIQERIAAGKTIVLCEGEKDADALWQMDIAATTNAGGSGKGNWRKSYTQTLRDAKSVVICSDNDEAGIAHAWRVWRDLGADKAIVLLLPGLAVKGDVSNWIEAGGTAEDFATLAKEARENPLEPPDEEPEVKDPPLSTDITNFKHVDKATVAYRIKEITELIWRHTDGWPRRVGELLFVDNGGDIRFLRTDAEVFAYLNGVAPVRWRSSGMAMNASYVPKSEMVAHLRFASKKYAQVESIPHEPLVDGFYYGWRTPKDYNADGRHLEKLLSFFENGSTADDTALIKAMFMTPAWGGLPGSRPAFCVMAVEQGSGKTVLTGTVGTLYGGIIEAELGRDREERIVTRVLSEGAMSKRVVRIDNAKTAVNSALIEGLITTQEISGHKLFAGEGSRPNMLTWLFNGNNLRLSRDLANRAFIISLEIPEPRPGWDEELSGFVNQNRDKILADIVAQLKALPYKIGAKDRWQAWCDGVLSRCTDDPNAVVLHNQERRDRYDDDMDEAKQIADAVGEHARNQQMDLNHTIFLKTKQMADIVNDAFGTKWTTKRVGQTINGHIAAGRLPNFEQTRQSGSRGYEIKLN